MVTKNRVFFFKNKFNNLCLIDSEIEKWNPKYGTNIWEHSGLFEGDIMHYQSKHSSKNGIIRDSAKWPNATIPYFIDDSFCKFIYPKEENSNQNCGQILL